MNDALCDHPKRDSGEFTLSFDFEKGKSNAKLPASEAAMLLHSKHILSDTVRLLQASDRAIEIFGVPLSSPVFQLLLVAGLTNVASALFRNSFGSTLRCAAVCLCALCADHTLGARCSARGAGVQGRAVLGCAGHGGWL